MSVGNKGDDVHIIRPPKRFVGLHAHSGFSTYDGLSLPQQHIDFVLNNEMDAWALTDHGNANGHSHAFTKWAGLKKKGRSFRVIPGCEFYIHPDLSAWREEWVAAKERKQRLKLQKKSETPDDEVGGGIVEDEEETKRTKWFDPVKRRHHLVVLAKNRAGLENLYTLITRSYDEGFYRFPRIDYRMLKEHGEGLVVSTACLGGPGAYAVLKNHQDVGWEDMLPNIGDDQLFQKIQREIQNEVVDPIVDAVGRENFFLEIQFNRLGAQHLVNQHMIAAARETGISLVATADSHYPGPGLWKDRELYKKLGWLNYDKYEPGLLPTSSDELKAELYPKNAQQMWDAYHDSVEHFSDRVNDWSFYDDNEVASAIERSYDIAHDLCEDAIPSRKVIYPVKNVLGDDWVDAPEDEQQAAAFKLLVEKVKEGLKQRGLSDKPEYIERAREELEVIRDTNFSLYFLTMARIMEIAYENLIVGPGRGSGAGSLVNYALGITHVDPIRYGLLFARFLSRSRAKTGAPDVDCIHAAHLVVMADGTTKPIGAVRVGDLVLDHNSQARRVLHHIIRDPGHDDCVCVRVKSSDGVIGDIMCVERHKFLTQGGDIVYAAELVPGQKLKASVDVDVIDKFTSPEYTYVDIQVEGTQTFRIIPFDVVEDDDGRLKSTCDYLGVTGVEQVMHVVRQ